MVVAVVGIGRVGSTVVRLVAERHAVIACDVVPEAAQQVADVATVASSPAEAANASDIVIVSVYDDAQLRAALDGPQGILAATDPPAAVVILSTVTLDTVRWAASRCEERGIGLLDCGIGRGGNVQRKTLVCMVGGEGATVELARPVLETFGDPVLHMGPLGSGMQTKIARNATYYGFLAVAWEGARLARSAGIDPHAFAEAARACDRQGMDPYEPVLIGLGSPLPYTGEPDIPQYFADVAHKDLRAAAELGAELGLDLPATHLTDQLFDDVMGVDPIARPSDA